MLHYKYFMLVQNKLEVFSNFHAKMNVFEKRVAQHGVACGLRKVCGGLGGLSNLQSLHCESNTPRPPAKRACQGGGGLTAPAGGTAAPFDLCLGVFGRGELVFAICAWPLTRVIRCLASLAWKRTLDTRK